MAIHTKNPFIHRPRKKEKIILLIFISEVLKYLHKGNPAARLAKEKIVTDIKAQELPDMSIIKGTINII